MADATLRIGVDTREANRALGSFGRSLQAIATGAVVGTFVKLADQATNLRNRLNQVSTSTEQSALLFDRLVTVANNARSPLATTGDLFFRISKNLDTLGISQNQALLATELVAKAISASGISAQEASGPLQQLGQALSSGSLQGDELRSILEGLPPVAKAVADSLGVPIGRLRELGSQGKISSQQVIQGILAAKTSIERDFGKTTATFGQQFTVLTNNFTVFIDKLNSATGATSTFGRAVGYLSDFIVFLGDNIGIITTLFEILFVVLITKGIGSLGKLVIDFAGSIRSIGFAFANTARNAANFFGTVVSRFKALKTSMAGTGAVPIVNNLDRQLRALVLPIGYLTTVAGQFFKSFAVPIGIAIAYVSDLLDPLIAKFTTLSNKIVNTVIPDALSGQTAMAGRGTRNTGEDFNMAPTNNAALLAALDKANKAREETTRAQREFDKEVQKSIQSLEIENNVIRLSKVLTEAEVAEYRARLELIYKAGAAGVTVNQQLLDQVGSLARQNTELRVQEELQKRLIELRDAAGAALEQVRQSDPEYAAKVKQVEALLDLETAYQEGLLQSQAEYLALRQQIDQQYVIDKYAAEDALFTRQEQLREIALSRELQRIGMTRKAAADAARSQVEFAKRTELEKAQFAIEQGASVFDSLGKYNRQAFAAAKAFNIANAIMNTYTGATKALAMYPPPFNFIAAAAVVAGGLAQVAQIRAQQYSGRALGGPVMSGESYIVGERGPEIFTPASTGSITPNTQLGTGGPLTVNFNIQANDTRGFDQLLAERRPMIINMIRTAQQDRGSKSPL